MKKLYYLAFVLCCLISYSVNSQSVYSEDFEDPNFLNQGWTTMQGATANAPDWQHNTQYGNYSVGCAVSYSWRNGANFTSDNFLISPEIDLTGVQDKDIELSYFWFNVNSSGAYLDPHDVYVMDTLPTSVNDILTNGELIIKEVGDGLGQHNKVVVPFKDYIDKKVYLVFHHSTTAQELIAIDDIRIGKPVLFDIQVNSLDVETYGFSMLGFYPPEQLPKFPYALTLENAGIEPIGGFVSDLTVSQQTDNFVEENSSVLQVGSQITTRGIWEVTDPMLLTSYDLEVNVTIDQTDDIPVNNMASRNNAVRVGNTWYGRVEPVYYDLMSSSGNDVFQGVTGNTRVTADNYINLPPLLQGPSGESVNKVLYGASFNLNTQGSLNRIKNVQVQVAPKSTGQRTWVEVYEYDNAFNTIGQEVKPIFTSDVILVPTGYDDGSIHTLVYDFEPFGGLGFEHNGNFVVCVVEEANVDALSIGILGFRDFFGNWSSGNSGIHAVTYQAGVEEVTTPFANSELYQYTNGQPVLTTWPISLEMMLFNGVQPNHDLSSAIKVYPNPVNDVAFIQIEESFKAKQLIVRDITGRNLLENDNLLGRTRVELNLSEFDSGVYFVEISNGEHTATKKVVLK